MPTSMPASPRILAFGKGDMGAGPYNVRFYDAVEAQGAEVTEAVTSVRWISKNAHRFDVAHIHWPSLLYAERSKVLTARRFAVALVILGLLRARGVKIVWTVHNLYPHERCVIPSLDRRMRQIMVQAASRFLVHGPTSERIVLDEFPRMRGRTTVIDFGHWIGAFPQGPSRADMREQLGIAADEKVLLFIGQARRYKNIHGLLDAAEQLERPVTVVVAGRFKEPDYEAEIRTLAANARQKVILRIGYVEDDVILGYVKAADALVAPYDDVLTSGTAMLALSNGRPLIAPNLGCLKDFVTPEAGLLYEPADQAGLLAALKEFATRQFDEHAILETARRRDWDNAARAFLDSVATP